MFIAKNLENIPVNALVFLLNFNYSFGREVIFNTINKSVTAVQLHSCFKILLQAK